VLGRTRAALLAALETPHSTTELAARTGMPAATVSRHLKALHAAGLATAHRVGRSVLYLRTPAAESLCGVPDLRASSAAVSPALERPTSGRPRSAVAGPADG
jgi:DNA-binding transcriptional ArsR family regulator